MTENEAQKWLERFEWDDSEETSEALATICEALQEYPKFKAIGTVNVFKQLKLKQHNYNNCHNYTCKAQSREDGYVDAVDEFANRMIAMMPGHRDDILLIAKQLKERSIWRD